MRPLSAIRTACLLLTAITWSPSAWAQEAENPVGCAEGSEPTPLVFGDHTTSCAVSPATDLDTFTFDGTAGDKIRYCARGTTAFFDPSIELRDPIGTLISGPAFCTGTNSGCAFCVDLDLAQTGTHTIFVTDSGTNEAGNYVLQVEKLLPIAPPAVAFDSSVLDSVSPGTDVDKYSFKGDAGTEIRFNVRGTTAFFDPRLEVRDPAGAVVFDSACAGTNSGCSFPSDLALSATGVYTLYVSDSGTNEAGNYQLHLQCLVGPCDSDGVAPPDPDPPFVVQEFPVLDDVNPGVDMDPFSFWGELGSLVRVSVLGTTAFFDPRVEIRDPSGALVDDAFCAGTNSGCSYSIEVSPASSGIYTLHVSDSGTNETGNYQFHLQCLVGPCDSDGDGLLDPNPRPHLPLSYNDPTDTGISPRVDIDSFSVAGTAGDILRVSLLGMTAFLDPRLEMRDPNGAVVLDLTCTGTSSGCSTTSTDTTLLLSGTYTVFVSDNGSDEQGTLEFNVQCLFGTCDDALPPGNLCTGGATIGCLDNCTFIENAGQGDVGGVGPASNPDGIGDPCQCGDVGSATPSQTPDGLVTGIDGTFVTRAALNLPPFPGGAVDLPDLDKCDVNGDGLCSGLDGTVIKRGSLSLPPGVKQTCPAALSP